MLAVPCFASGDSLSTVQNFVLNRDSGVVPSGFFKGLSGMDGNYYTLTPGSYGWESDFLYQWSDFSSPSSYFAFQSFNSSIVIPVNIPVPLAESNLVFFPDFYFVYTGLGDNISLSSFDLKFYDSSGDIYKTVSLLPKSSVNSDSRIISFDGESVDLGVGNWVLRSFDIRLYIGNSVLVSSSAFTFGISGFSFTLTSSISFSDYLTKQTQDILTNEVVPAVETLNNTMNNVNSSVQDVNTAVQAVDEAVSQGNQTLTEISQTLEDMPQSVVDALDSKANEEAEEFSIEVDEKSQEALEEIEKVMALTDFQTSLTALATSFGNESRLDTLTFPAGKLPDSIGGGVVLWEEQEIPISSTINKFPTVFVTIVRAFLEIVLMWSALYYLYRLISSCFGKGSEDE